MRNLLLWVALLTVGPAQAGTGYVYLAKNTYLYYVDGEQVYTPDKSQLLYFKKGNIFFTGSTDEKQNIYLLTTAADISAGGLQLIYERDNREPTYSFANRKFYAGKPESEEARQRAELLHVERTGRWWAFYSSVNDSLLGYYDADSLPPSIGVITAYALAVKYKLTEQLSTKVAEGPFEQKPFVSIKPIWGNVTANEWIWDGQYLRPRWNVDPRLVWVFDGQIVKQAYENNIYEQYQWDGETFKPLWRSNRAQEWVWDGRIAKPAWDTDWANQYQIESRVIKPWSNVHPEKEWQTDGDIPLPLIILVISGIARSY